MRAICCVALCGTLALYGCSAHLSATAPIDSGLRDPDTLKSTVRDKLPASDHAALDELEITSGPSGTISFLVEVRGVIPSSGTSQRIQDAIQDALRSEEGQLKWLVTESAGQQVPNVRLVGEDSDAAGRASATEPSTESSDATP